MEYQPFQLLHPSHPLSASPTTLTIAKGGSGTFEISGGAPSYTVESDKTSVTASVNVDVVTVAVDAGSTANTATITVTDQNEDTVDVEVTITAE